MRKILMLLFLTFTFNFSLYTLNSVFAAGPSTISYQGRLRESGQPVSGTRSIQFKLYDQSSGGAAVFNSGAQSIYVSSGIFSYQLGGQGFKDLSWATSSYWLEISVGGNAMTPREQINAIPYAFMASTAASLNGSGNIQITGAGNHYILNGNVGIGVPAPSTKLELNGNMRFTADGGIAFGGQIASTTTAPNTDGSYIYSEKDYFGVNNDALIIEKTDYNAIAPDGAIVIANRGMDNISIPALTVRGNGRVGIGTTNPTGLFQVGGGSLTVLQNGNIGIGTLSPASNGSIFSRVLHLHTDTPNQWAIVHTTNYETGSLAADGAIFGVIGENAYMFNYEPGRLVLATNSIERLSVLSNGNVGIGKTNPIQKLDVEGPVRASAFILSTGTVVSATMSANQTCSIDTIVKVNFNTAGTDTNSEFSTSNNRFTSKTDQWVFVSASISIYGPSQDDNVIMYIYKNDQKLYRYTNSTAYDHGDDFSTTISATQLVYTAANDTIDVRVKTHSGGTPTYTVLKDSSATHLDIISK